MAAEQEKIVEMSFSRGQMRQPGLWGKICQPNGGIMEYDNNPDMYDLEAKGPTTKITLKGYPEDSYLVIGVKGYHAAGMLSLCYVLFQIKYGQHSEWTIPGSLAKFEGKNLLLINQSETDLQPIYKSLTDLKYAHLSRLQDFLRKEKKDRAAEPAPPPPKA
jgi:hypothetical protein